MSQKALKYCIILATGKGIRMGFADLYKLCFCIEGTPFINHNISVYKRCGIMYPIVVVGSMSSQVMETIGSEYDDITMLINLSSWNCSCGKARYENTRCFGWK